MSTHVVFRFPIMLSSVVYEDLEQCYYRTRFGNWRGIRRIIPQIAHKAKDLKPIHALLYGYFRVHCDVSFNA